MNKSNLMEKMRAVFWVGFQACLLAGITIFAVMPVGCTLDNGTGTKTNGDLTSPVITDVKVVDEKNIEIDFSESVTVEEGSVTDVEKINDENAVTDENLNNENNLNPEISYNDDNTKVIVTLPEETVAGNDYIITGQVEDENGNTLTFSIPFKGYNGNLPKVVMTEIQTESVSQNTSEKNKGTYRNEFIEFLALSDGNLTGLELISAYDGEERKYIFPKIDVKTGEVFVVHLRNRGEGCISEEGDDLALAFGGYAKDGIRDLWCDSEATALGNGTDIIVLKNSADGSIWDAVMFRDEKTTEWSAKYVDYASKLYEAGFCSSSGVENAVLTEGMTSSKTLSRKNAYDLQQSVLDGVDISYPLSFVSADWEISSESCGVVKE